MPTPPINQPNISESYADEINLTELVEILIRRRWLIVAGSFVSALIVGIYTSLIPKQYSSEALILVSPSIVKPNSEKNEGTQISEVTISSLEASTYEVLAKSDELMLDLADTLRALTATTPEILEGAFGGEDTHSIANALIQDLEIELLQDTGQRNIRSTTPLLVLRYQSAEDKLAPLVVNNWATLFLQRNQGLSSNVTDSFYENIVIQYERAKQNLEQKETELAKLNASNSELNRFKTELKLRSIRLDTSLQNFQHFQTILEEKHRDFVKLTSDLQILENQGLWVGYLTPASTEIHENRANSMLSNLVETASNIKRLSADSSFTEKTAARMFLELEDRHRQLRIDFDQLTNFSKTALELKHTNDMIKNHLTEAIRLESITDSLQQRVYSLQSSLDAQKPVLTVRKAITDDVLWERTNSARELDVKAQESLGRYWLSSEEINPVYLNLNQSLVKAKTELFFNKNRKAFLETNVDTLEERSIKLHSRLLTLREQRTKLEERIQIETVDLRQKNEQAEEEINLQLQLQRSVFADYKDSYKETKMQHEILKHELIKLEKKTNFHEENYVLWRNELTRLAVKVDSLELERRRIERDVKVYQESFNRFVKLQEEARIARQQATGDIQIVSMSKISKTVPNNLKKKTLVAALFGLIISAGIISLQHIRKKAA